MPQGAAYGSQKNGTGSWSGGRSTGSASGGSSLPPTGLRGPLGEGGLPVHTNQTGPAGIATGQSDPSKFGNGGVGSNYQGAVADYVHNYVDDPLSRVVNFFTGIGLRKPNINQAATYAKGLAHTGFNPAEQIGGLVGMFGPPGTGFLLGKAAGLAYDELGGRPTIIGDAGPGTPGNEVHDFSHPTTGPASTSGKQNGSGDGSLLPPIFAAPAPSPAVTAPIPQGSALPPVTAPVPNFNPGAQFMIPGPTPYGWQRPGYGYN